MKIYESHSTIKDMITTLAGKFCFYSFVYQICSSHTFNGIQLLWTFYSSNHILHINSWYQLCTWETSLDKFWNFPTLVLHNKKLLVFEEWWNFINRLCHWSPWELGPDKLAISTSDFSTTAAYLRRHNNKYYQVYSYLTVKKCSVQSNGIQSERCWHGVHLIRL